jgi:hypothetical protein
MFNAPHEATQLEIHCTKSIRNWPAGGRDLAQEHGLIRCQHLARFLVTLGEFGVGGRRVQEYDTDRYIWRASGDRREGRGKVVDGTIELQHEQSATRMRKRMVIVHVGMQCHARTIELARFEPLE